MKKISICIVTYNNAQNVLNAISSIIKCTKDVDYDIYISDNNSTDNTVDLIKTTFPTINIIKNDKNLGFGGGHNRVINQIKSDYHIVVNPDIVIDYNVIFMLYQYLEQNNKVVLVCPKILNFDKTEQFLPKKNPKFLFLLGGRIKAFEKYRKIYTMENQEITSPIDVDFCTGCFMMFRTSAIKKIGGFDERYFMYFEDADISREAKKIGRVVFNPNEYVYHNWERGDTHNFKLLFYHTVSMIKYFIKWNKI